MWAVVEWQKGAKKLLKLLLCRVIWLTLSTIDYNCKVLSFPDNVLGPAAPIPNMFPFAIEATYLSLGSHLGMYGFLVRFVFFHVHFVCVCFAFCIF